MIGAPTTKTVAAAMVTANLRMMTPLVCIDQITNTSEMPSDIDADQ
jgi:hypothetical protein